MDTQFWLTLAGVILSVICCVYTMGNSIKTDVSAIRKDMKDFEVTMTKQSEEFRGLMAAQSAEFRGIMAKQDAEFKMFLRCGRLPLVRRGLKSGSDKA